MLKAQLSPPPTHNAAFVGMFVCPAQGSHLRTHSDCMPRPRPSPTISSLGHTHRSSSSSLALPSSSSEEDDPIAAQLVSAVGGASSSRLRFEVVPRHFGANAYFLWNEAYDRFVRIQITKNRNDWLMLYFRSRELGGGEILIPIVAMPRGGPLSEDRLPRRRYARGREREGIRHILLLFGRERGRGRRSLLLGGRRRRVVAGGIGSSAPESSSSAEARGEEGPLAGGDPAALRVEREDPARGNKRYKRGQLTYDEGERKLISFLGILCLHDDARDGMWHALRRVGQSRENGTIWCLRYTTGI